ncbi:energy-coupling factor ABC transporter ATP-binding protein [Paenibacillus methanolicus]|uniref:Cobalt/nickel transport system ATP-binding protein n=1 Tax=Paenibacillus methanolicus TaxID=582686 RepID=A0A5S5CIF0_9BACL|nr:ABC transporter ATP-binding protein [Paenibacillus methanolicus]TYP79530.1 cobalt/nickel transport system ATP-binding protein [Paenibacillus methanolicus]
MNDIIACEGISYTYPAGRKPALDRLTVRIPQGKKTALLGRNGSGKSTFFLQLLGLLRPDRGTMRFRGQLYPETRRGLRGIREQIGLVFQDPEQQLILNTPYEDVSYGLRNAGVPEPEIRDRVREALHAMGMTEAADTPIHALSLGQKKRVALSGAMVMRPSVLLLDEPTAYLDRATERALLDELARIHDEEGVTMVMATHDMNLAYEWADHCIVVQDGHCVMEDAPERLFDLGESLRDWGLSRPAVLDLWGAIPPRMRLGHPTPRSLTELEGWLRDHLE